MLFYTTHNLRRHGENDHDISKKKTYDNYPITVCSLLDTIVNGKNEKSVLQKLPIVEKTHIV